MNDFRNRMGAAGGQVIGGAADTELGLKSFMLGTYRWMALAMLVTAGVAYMLGMQMRVNPSIAATLRSPLLVLGFVIGIPVLFAGVGRKLPTMSMGGVLTFLFGFAAVLGVFMSVIAAFVDPMVTAKIFFMTVAMFGALSMFGYTTKFNLTAIVKYAFAVFLGYVVLRVAGMFIPALAVTGPLDTIITVVALAAIAAITAWETQMLKRVYYSMGGDTQMLNKMSAYGAASLLLAFVNMFQLLMSLFGRD